MTISFFGLSRPASAVCDALTRVIKAYRKENGGALSPLEPGGVFVPDFTKGANFAAQRSMAAHINGLDLVKKSDIIFVFVGDKTLKSFAHSMRRHNITGKIFCHFNPSYDAEILDFDPDNTYVSFLIPATKKGVVDFSDGLIMQGYGSDYDVLSDSLEKIGIRISHVTSDEKCIYMGAINMLVSIPEYCQNAALKLVKSILGKDSFVKDTIKDRLSHSECEFGFRSLFEGSDEDADYIENQIRLFKTMGYDDASLLYALLLLLESGKRKDGSSFRLREIAKNIIKKY